MSVRVRIAASCAFCLFEECSHGENGSELADCNRFMLHNLSPGMVTEQRIAVRFDAICTDQ